jgi:methionine sulfoxide reductase heme-binding subunit
MHKSATKFFLSISFFLIFFMIILGGVHFVKSEEKKLDYKKETVVDSDLDGLTDLGEKEIFKTDPINPDTDGDGILDGAEIVGESNPLDNASPSAKETIFQKTYIIEKETSWAWYLTRSSALLGFFLLWISIFLGVSIRTPLLNKIIKPVYSVSIHGWISLQALFFALVHGISLLFDKLLSLNIFNIFIPFYPLSEKQENIINPDFLALGIISFYVMLILVLTSYLRKFIPRYLWRAVHSLNIGLYVVVVIHALYLGTDLKTEGLARNIFIYANIFLAALFIINILVRLFKAIFHRNNQEASA